MRTATSSHSEPSSVSEAVGVPPNHQTESAVEVGLGAGVAIEDDDIVGMRKACTGWWWRARNSSICSIDMVLL